MLDSCIVCIRLVYCMLFLPEPASNQRTCVRTYGWLAGCLAGMAGWLGWLAGWLLAGWACQLLAGCLEKGDLVPVLSHARRLRGRRIILLMREGFSRLRRVESIIPQTLWLAARSVLCRVLFFLPLTPCSFSRLAASLG